MGPKKFIGIIFLLITIILVVFAVDIYLTATALQDVDPKTLVKDPSYVVSDDNSTITISVDVDLPEGGFIPKGIVIELRVTFDSLTQTVEEEVNLGESKTLNIPFTLESSHVTKLASGQSLTVSAKAIVTPTIFGYVVDFVSQEVDLGSNEVSG